MTCKSALTIFIALVASFIALRLFSGTVLQPFALVAFSIVWIPVSFGAGGLAWWYSYKFLMNLMAPSLGRKPIDESDLKRTFGVKAPYVKPGTQGQVIDMTGRFNRKN